LPNVISYLLENKQKIRMMDVANSQTTGTTTFETKVAS
jgi:hypothetical protein